MPLEVNTSLFTEEDWHHVRSCLQKNLPLLVWCSGVSSLRENIKEAGSALELMFQFAVLADDAASASEADTWYPHDDVRALYLSCLSSALFDFTDSPTNGQANKAMNLCLSEVADASTPVSLDKALNDLMMTGRSILRAYQFSEQEVEAHLVSLHADIKVFREALYPSEVVETIPHIDQHLLNSAQHQALAVMKGVSDLCGPMLVFRLLRSESTVTLLNSVEMLSRLEEYLRFHAVVKSRLLQVLREYPGLVGYNHKDLAVTLARAYWAAMTSVDRRAITQAVLGLRQTALKISLESFIDYFVSWCRIIELEDSAAATVLLASVGVVTDDKCALFEAVVVEREAGVTELAHTQETLLSMAYIHAEVMGWKPASLSTQKFFIMDPRLIMNDEKLLRAAPRPQVAAQPPAPRRHFDRAPDRHFDRAADRYFDRAPDRFVDRAPDRPADHPYDRPADRPYNRPVDRAPDRYANFQGGQRNRGGGFGHHHAPAQANVAAPMAPVAAPAPAPAPAGNVVHPRGDGFNPAAFRGYNANQGLNKDASLYKDCVTYMNELVNIVSHVSTGTPESWVNSAMQGIKRSIDDGCEQYPCLFEGRVGRVAFDTQSNISLANVAFLPPDWPTYPYVSEVKTLAGTFATSAVTIIPLFVGNMCVRIPLQLTDKLDRVDVLLSCHDSLSFRLSQLFSPSADAQSLRIAYEESKASSIPSESVFDSFQTLDIEDNHPVSVSLNRATPSGKMGTKEFNKQFKPFMKDVKDPQITSKMTRLLASLLHRLSEVSPMESITFPGSEVSLHLVDDAPFNVMHNIPHRTLHGPKAEALLEKGKEWVRYGFCTQVFGDVANIIPIVVVPKPGGKWRVCFDTTILNRYLDDVPIDLPAVDDILRFCNGAHYLSQIDLSDAFTQLRLHQDSQRLVRVMIGGAVYEMKRAVFGIKTIPAWFQRIMSTMLAGIPHVMVYIDNIIIASKTAASHFKILSRVLAVLLKYRVRVNMKKLELFRPEMKVLGFVVSGQGIRPDPEKVRPILDVPLPVTVSELRSFLGQYNYQTGFIPHASTVLSSLHELTGNNARGKIKWTEEDKRAFTKAKIALALPIMLFHPLPNEKRILYTDASDEGMAAALGVIRNGRFHTWRLWSRKFKSYEKAWPVNKKEFAALHFGVLKFYDDLVNQRFEARVDHQALIHGLNTEGVNAVFARWKAFLSSLSFDLVHVPGVDNPIADYFSRVRALDVHEEHESIVDVSKRFIHPQYIYNATNMLDIDSNGSVTYSMPVISENESQESLRDDDLGWLDDTLLSDIPAAAFEEQFAMLDELIRAEIPSFLVESLDSRRVEEIIESRPTIEEVDIVVDEVKVNRDIDFAKAVIHATSNALVGELTSEQRPNNGVMENADAYDTTLFTNNDSIEEPTSDNTAECDADVPISVMDQSAIEDELYVEDVYTYDSQYISMQATDLLTNDYDVYDSQRQLDLNTAPMNLVAIDDLAESDLAYTDTLTSTHHFNSPTCHSGSLEAIQTSTDELVDDLNLVEVLEGYSPGVDTLEGYWANPILVDDMVILDNAPASDLVEMSSMETTHVAVDTLCTNLPSPSLTDVDSLSVQCDDPTSPALHIGDVDEDRWLDDTEAWCNAVIADNDLLSPFDLERFMDEEEERENRAVAERVIVDVQPIDEDDYGLEAVLPDVDPFLSLARRGGPGARVRLPKLYLADQGAMGPARNPVELIGAGVENRDLPLRGVLDPDANEIPPADINDAIHYLRPRRDEVTGMLVMDEITLRPGELPLEDDIPTDETKEILFNLVHFDSAHGGLPRMHYFLKLYNRDWKGVTTYLKERLLSCTKCMRYKKGARHHIPRRSADVEEPVHSVQLDLASMPLDEGYRYILIIHDVYCGYVYAEPLMDKRKETIANAFLAYCSRFGLPKFVQSDQGKEFVNALMAILAKELRITYNVSPPYYPEANGRVERSVGTVKQALAALCSPTYESWSTCLPWAVMAINRSIHDNTRHSPFSLMFGRYGYSFLLDAPPNEPENDVSWTEHLQLMKSAFADELNEIRADRRRVEEAKRDASVPISEVRLYDAVYYLNPSYKTSKSSSPIWYGPCVVVEVDDYDNCILATPRNKVLQRAFPRNHLRVGHFLGDLPRMLVNEINEHRASARGPLEFLISFDGYDHNADEWIPLSIALNLNMFADYCVRSGLNRDGSERL